MLFEPKIIQKLQNLIMNSNKFVVIGHKNPDADCLGCTLALNYFFKELSKESIVIIPDEIPRFLKWTYKKENIRIYQNDKDTCEQLIKETDIIFLVDFNDTERAGNVSEAIKNSKKIKINIDHHQQPKDIADYAFIDPKSSSAAELVYNFIKHIAPEKINTQIAECVFLGIVGDTGSFMYDTVSSQTFSVTSELLTYNIDRTRIINGLYNNHSFDRLQLLGYMLAHKMINLKEKQTIVTSLSLNEQKKYRYKNGDHENFVNYPLQVKDNILSVFLFETNECVRLSLRSKGKFDVNKVANHFFNGGGHINASGGKLYLSVDESINYIIENIDEIIKIGNS